MVTAPCSCVRWGEECDGCVCENSASLLQSSWASQPSFHHASSCPNTRQHYYNEQHSYNLIIIDAKDSGNMARFSNVRVPVSL